MASRDVNGRFAKAKSVASVSPAEMSARALGAMFSLSPGNQWLAAFFGKAKEPVREHGH